MPNTEFVMLVIFFFTLFLLVLKKESLKKITENLFSKKEKEKYQQICPKCGSEKIENNFTNRAGIAYGASIGKKCNACGYEGQFYIEVEEKDSKKVPAKIKNKGKSEEIEQMDMTFGKGYAFFAIIFGALSVLFGVVIIFMDEGLFVGIVIVLEGMFFIYCGKKRQSLRS
ncbi:hypothetical protein HZC31_01630 [Candidatus Woesearchaeota archaeon]|nr:hypothetical protein [Candidatus Woesearchaeota archaeon]